MCVVKISFVEYIYVKWVFWCVWEVYWVCCDGSINDVVVIVCNGNCFIYLCVGYICVGVVSVVIEIVVEYMLNLYFDIVDRGWIIIFWCF